MGKVLLVLRILLGLFLLVSGLNKIPPVGPFLPVGELSPEVARQGEALGSTYLFPWLVGLTEVFIGLLLVIGCWVPLAFLMLVPLSINIVWFHIATGPAGGIPAYIVAGLNLLFLLVYRKHYAPLLARK